MLASGPSTISNFRPTDRAMDVIELGVAMYPLVLTILLTYEDAILLSLKSGNPMVRTVIWSGVHAVLLVCDSAANVRCV
jgi:hypothetical protein